MKERKKERKKEREKEVVSMSRTLSSEPYSVYVNTLCGQNVEFVSVKPVVACAVMIVC